MNVYLSNLGCARNQIDGEIMLGRLKQWGATVVDAPEAAEVIVVNTCSFIEAAADESIDTVLELAELKRTGACRRLVVTGCLPERYREKIAEALPEVDLFLGTGAFERIGEVIDDAPGTNRCLLPDPNAVAPADADAPRLRSPGPMAYVRIAEGCSRSCTYCIIPRLRGRQRSRPVEEVLSEARRLLDSGVRELVLVAQDTTAYGCDRRDGAGLARLLERLARLQPGGPGHWVRFLYGHPQSIDPAVVAAVAKHANICRYFDIPIQHASRGVLKRMGRPSAPDELRRLFDTIRETIPDAALRTTVIVGFPGETEADFNELLDFIETVRFDHLGCFVYSDAEDLPSHRLPDPVPPSLAKTRHRRVMELQQAVSRQRNQAFNGRTLTVLVEDRPEAGLYLGRTMFQAPEVDGVTYVHADRLSVGDFARVRITDTLEYDLIGEAP
jgi:ribosomal protein S12 methylthiotransferase